MLIKMSNCYALYIRYDVRICNITLLKKLTRINSDKKISEILESVYLYFCIFIFVMIIFEEGRRYTYITIKASGGRK